jgi:hypothetical protein
MRDAGDHPLSAECDDRITCDEYARGIHVGRTAPVGMDLLGQPWSEPTLLRVAYAYERAVAPRKPPKTTPPLAAR